MMVEESKTHTRLQKKKKIKGDGATLAPSQFHQSPPPFIEHNKTEKVPKKLKGNITGRQARFPYSPHYRVQFFTEAPAHPTPRGPGAI